MNKDTMNRYEKVNQSEHWKDRLAGWCEWRIHCPQCNECGKRNVSYTLHGTRHDAERFASNPEMNCCETCQ